MAKPKIKFVVNDDDDDDAPPGESTPLLTTTLTTTGSSSGIDSEDRRQLMLSFRRKSYAKLVSRQTSQRRLSVGDIEGGGGDAGGIGIIARGGGWKLDLDDDLPMAHPVEGLAPLFPNGGIGEFDGRGHVPYRAPSLVKSTPAFAPYRRMARHRSFYLWWTNVSTWNNYFLSVIRLQLVILSFAYIGMQTTHHRPPITKGISSLVEKFSATCTPCRTLRLLLRSTHCTLHPNP
jgi:hypothetical protein